MAVKVATRNIPQYRDPAVILIDQMKEIYIDGELDAVETANWFPKIARKDYMIGANLTGQRRRRPGSPISMKTTPAARSAITPAIAIPNSKRCSMQQSEEPDQDKRKKLVWEIDRQLQEDAARPMIFNYRLATCHYPRVHGITIMINSLFNGWRFEDAWVEH